MKSRAALATLLVLAACTTTDPRASVESAAPESPAPTVGEPIPEDCVNPPPDVGTLIEHDRRAACYGNADLTIEAHAALTGGAVDCPGELDPSWLACGGTIVELYPLDAAGVQPPIILAARSPHSGPYLSAVLHPDSGIDLQHGLDAPVTAIGHFDDPAAATCHYVSWPDDQPPAPAEVVAQCRETFVITELALLDVGRRGDSGLGVAADGQWLSQ